MVLTYLLTYLVQWLKRFSVGENQRTRIVRWFALRVRPNVKLRSSSQRRARLQFDGHAQCQPWQRRPRRLGLQALLMDELRGH